MVRSIPHQRPRPRSPADTPTVSDGDPYHAHRGAMVCMVSLSREKEKCLPNGQQTSKRLPSIPCIPTGYVISEIERVGYAVRSIPRVGLWKTGFWTVFGPSLDLVEGNRGRGHGHTWQ